MFRGFAILLVVTALAMGQAMVQHAAAAAGGAAAAAGSKKVADSLEKVLGGAANAAATAAGTKPADPQKQVVAAVPPPTPPTGKRVKHSPFEPQVSRAGGSQNAPAVEPARAGIPSPYEVEASSNGESLPNTPWVSRRAHVPQYGPVPAFTPFVTNDAPTPAASRGARRGIGTPQMAEAVIVPPIAPMTVALPATIISAPVVPPPPPPAMATREKLAGIQNGATYQQIVASLGKPASKIEMIEDGKVLESLRIESRGNKIGTIRLVDGVVTSIEPVER